jgi:hypothetical protein
MENEKSIVKRGMGINYKGNQDQTKRAVLLQEYYYYTVHTFQIEQNGTSESYENCCFISCFIDDFILIV